MPGALGRIANALVLFGCATCCPDACIIPDANGAIFHSAQTVAGRFPFPTEPIRTPSPDDTFILRLRSTISAEDLYRAARRVFSIERGVRFSFSHAASADSGNLILRYFAPIPRIGPIPRIDSIPRIERYAGYSIQFCIDRGRGTVTKIYVEKVPLE